MARPPASTSTHGPSATRTAELSAKAKRQPSRKCSVARKIKPGAMPSRSLSPVRRRLPSEDTDPSHSRASKPVASQAAPSAIEADLMTKAHILNSLTDPFWRTVISTPLDSREPAEEAAGYRLTSAEHQCWTSLAAIRPVLLGSPGLFFTPSQTPDIWTRKALLKSNIASLFVTLLTTPSELCSKPIGMFISQLIINKEFSTKKCVKIFVEFLAEFELQKWFASSLGKTAQSTTSFLDRSPAPQFALQDYVEFLTGEQDLQLNFEQTTIKAFKDAFEVAYEDSLGRKPDEIEVKGSYFEFLGSIIDLVCHEFPELAELPASVYRLTKTRTPQPVRSLSQVREHKKAPANKLTVTRGEGDEEHDRDKSVSRSRSASQSFLIDTLRPTESESQIDDDGPREAYSGPCAGSPEARHHENVAGEVAANANIFIGFSRELGKSSNGFSDRGSHSVSGLPDEGEGLKEPRILPVKKFDFTRRQPDASQASWSETLVVLPERRSDDGQTRSEAFAAAGQKEEPLSPNIHAELELHQDNSHDPEPSSEQKPGELAEEGQPGIGSPGSSDAPQQQQSSSNESIRFLAHQENPTKPGEPTERRDRPTLSQSGSLDPKSVAPWEIFLGMEQGAERQNECGTSDRATASLVDLPVAVGNVRLGNQPQCDGRHGSPPQHPDPDRPPSERTAAYLGRTEEEGTRTVRPQDRQRPGLDSKLESPVERHHRNLKEKAKQMVSQASASKHEMTRVAGGKTKRPLNEFETDSESDDTSLGRGGEKANDQALSGSAARTKKEDIDSRPWAEGSETTQIRAKRQGELEHSKKLVSASNKTDDEQWEKDRKLKKRKRRDDGGKGRQRTPSNERCPTGDKATEKNSKPKREDTMVESDESSPTNRASSMTKKGTASRASPVTGRRRQAWTEEQEDLLIKEVIRFSGKMYNCMAYILQRHGTGGTESQVLASRTNVMLKDKAVQITTKWAREGKRLSKKTLDAFARFPPKSGGVLLGLTHEEEEARRKTVEERKRSRSRRAESCANEGHESGSERKEILESRVSPAKSTRPWTSLSPLHASAFLISENPRVGEPSGDGDIGTFEREQVPALTPQRNMRASDAENANVALQLGVFGTPAS